MNTKNLVACLALFTILISTFMDINSTHMTNPLWAPHARFHWSIQYFSCLFYNLIAIYLLYGKYEGSGSRLAFIIATLAPLFFWGMFFPSLLMPGTSSWPDGMEPFFIIAPNVIVAVVVTGLCFWALAKDKALRLSGKSFANSGE